MKSTASKTRRPTAQFLWVGHVRFAKTTSVSAMAFTSEENSQKPPKRRIRSVGQRAPSAGDRHIGSVGQRAPSAGHSSLLRNLGLRRNGFGLRVLDLSCLSPDTVAELPPSRLIASHWVFVSPGANFMAVKTRVSTRP